MADSIRVQCRECKNDKHLSPEETEGGRWFECDYCGATYEITGKKGDGSLEIHMVEEEK